MNAAHKLGKCRNRLVRLKKKVAAFGADRQGVMNNRISQLEEMLRKK